MKPSGEFRAASSPRSAQALSPLRLTSAGRVLDQHPEAFGVLRDSSALATDGKALRARLDEDGYVFLRKLLDVGVLSRIQKLIAQELARLDLLDPAGDVRVDALPARSGSDLYC